MFGKNFPRARPRRHITGRMLNQPTAATEGLTRLRFGPGVQHQELDGIPLVRIVGGGATEFRWFLAPNGIPGRSGAVAGSAVCQGYTGDPSNFVLDAALDDVVWDCWAVSPPAGADVLAFLDSDGSWKAIDWTCATTNTTTPTYTGTSTGTTTPPPSTTIGSTPPPPAPPAGSTTTPIVMVPEDPAAPGNTAPIVATTTASAGSGPIGTMSGLGASTNLGLSITLTNDGGAAYYATAPASP